MPGNKLGNNEAATCCKCLRYIVFPYIMPEMNAVWVVDCLQTANMPQNKRKYNFSYIV